jgi:hypothetical protein
LRWLPPVHFTIQRRGFFVVFGIEPFSGRISDTLNRETTRNGLN